MPRDGSPYVSLRGFTGRTLRRSGWASRHTPAPRLEWAGDAPRPGSESSAPSRRNGNGGTPNLAAPANGTPANGGQASEGPPAGGAVNGVYDDGFGPMPSIPARAQSSRGRTTRPPRSSGMGIMLSSGTTARDALDWIQRKIEQGVALAGSDVSPPSLYRLGSASGTFVTAWKAGFGLTSLIAPGNAFLAGLPSLAAETGVTLSIGPALDTPLFGGGVGAVFAPDGQVALFGAGEISVDFDGLSEFVSSLKLALQAKMKLGYNRDGLDGFASLAKVASVNIGEEIVVGAELWLDGAGNGLGGAVSVGVGMALQLAAEPTRPPVRMRPARGTATVAPRVGIMLSSGTTAADALNWIMRKVEQAAAVMGSDVSPPSMLRLGGSSSTFVTAWQAVFGLTSLISPTNGFFAALPGLAADTGVTLSVGPALDTPLFGGGVGVVFAPDGQVALFGGGEVSVDFDGLSEFISSLKLALQAKMKLGYNRGGLDGFASLAKVASVNVGEEVVVGAELWLDASGSGLGGAVSIGAGFALQFAADQRQRMAKGRGRTALPPPAAARRAPATALVVGREDREKARRYARDFTDLFQWVPPAAVASEMAQRGFAIQTIDAAVGDLNLDFYKVDITRFPDGWDGPKFLQHFMRHINDFIDTDNTEFIPYSTADADRLASASPRGAVFKLDIAGPDNAAVVISDVQPQYFSVTTVHTPETGDHPVSGHRMFGYANEQGKTVFFTRAADRPTTLPQGFQQIIFLGAEALWESLQRKVAAFVNNNGGAATIVPPFSERFDPTAVREEFGHYDIAQGMALEAGDEIAAAQPATSAPAAPAPTIVPAPMPGDARVRAERIGGAFAGRIGEALDLGLEPKSLDGLLDTLDPPAAAQPMGMARPQRRQPMARAQAVTRSVNWDEVELIPQPTDQTCWAAAAAMIIGWRDRVSLTPETVAQICSRSTVQGLSAYDREAFAAEIGLQTEPPQSYSIDGFYDLLTYNGPLWVSKIPTSGSTGGHAVVVTGMYTDGDQTYVRIADPWDRVVGTPGAPGGYANTHGTGSRYIMRYEDFHNEYELRIVGNPPTRQILHAGGTDGRAPNTGTGTAPPGYAMAAPAAARNGRNGRAARARTRAMDAGATATIAGTVITLLAGNTGDISWNVPQWAGIKHPNDQPPATEAEYRDAVIELDQWPKIGGTFGLDDIYAWFRIRWQYNGTSLGRVYVQPRGNDDAVGWGLTVSGTIEDDSRLYPRSASAPVAGPAQVPALHVVMNYVFDEVIADNHIATSRITLYADGTHEIDSEWIQHARPFPAEPRDVARTR